MRLIILTFVLFSKPFSQVDYNSQIQPIFDTNCTTCHNYAGSATLNLTSFSGLINGGVSGPSIIAGDHENSLLYQRLILPVGSAGSMPPNVPLSQSEIDLIAQWIDEGAGNLLTVNDYLIPKEFILHQNYPNPFNPSTVISFSLSKEEFVSIDIYDMTGKHIISLMNGKKKVGTHNINWSGRDKNDAPITTGQYLYQLRTSSSSTFMKMLFIK